jgi:cell division protein FtsB
MNEGVKKAIVLIIVGMVLVVLSGVGMYRTFSQLHQRIAQLEKENTTYRNACQDWSAINKDLKEQLDRCTGIPKPPNKITLSN